MRFNALVGFGYGTILTVLGFMAAGTGHGSYIPLAVSSSPAALLGVPAALFGAPVLWATIGALAARGQKWVRGILLLHYAVAVWLVTGGPFADWEYLSQVQGFAPLLIASWVCAYGIGQVVVWQSLLSRPA